MAERAQHLADHDALTGLPNRRILEDRLTQALALSQRNRKQTAVMFVDLDRFKAINDSLGHSVGDLVLKEVAKRLKIPRHLAYMMVQEVAKDLPGHPGTSAGEDGGDPRAPETDA